MKFLDKFLTTLSLKRNLTQVIWLAVLGVLSVNIATYAPKELGPYFAPLMLGFGYIFLAAAAAQTLLAVVDRHTDPAALVESAVKENNTAAALVLLGRSLLIAAALIVMAGVARAAEPPIQAKPYLPIIKQEQQAYWKELKKPSFIGSMIEQETCPSLHAYSCWNPKAQLLTSREQGVGLGQITRAYDNNHKLRFDLMAEMVARYPTALKGLTWDNWQDPQLQIRAIVLKNSSTFRSITGAATQEDQLAFLAAAYNGGNLGLAKDRLACRATTGCNDSKWFGNVENTSLKSKAILPGYGGQSPFSINRTYVKNILIVRRPRYLSLDA